MLQVFYNFIFQRNLNNFIKITGRQDVTDLSDVLQRKYQSCHTNKVIKYREDNNLRHTYIAGNNSH